MSFYSSVRGIRSRREEAIGIADRCSCGRTSDGDTESRDSQREEKQKKSGDLVMADERAIGALLQRMLTAEGFVTNHTLFAAT